MYSTLWRLFYLREKEQQHDGAELMSQRDQNNSDDGLFNANVLKQTKLHFCRMCTEYWEDGSDKERETYFRNRTTNA